jgi:hypothetical protein
MMKRILTLVIALLVIQVVPAVCFATEPQEFVEQFFSQIRGGKIAEGYDGLFAGSGIPATKPQAFELIKTQTSGFLPMYGRILGYEKIKEEKFGTSVARLVYILKSENAPTVWEFFFYKPNTNWFLGNVLFNDQFKNLVGKD